MVKDYNLARVYPNSLQFKNINFRASEDIIEGGGSFDSSGAFHGTLEDDDTQANDSNVKRNRRTSMRADDSNQMSKESSLEPVQPPPPKLKNNQPQTQEKIENKDRNSVAEDKKNVPTGESDKKRTFQMEQNVAINNQNKKVDGVAEDANKENSSATGNMAINAKKEPIMPTASHVQPTNFDSSNDDIESHQQSMKAQSQHKQSKLSRPPMSESASVDRMQEVADDMVKNLISDDEISSNERDVSGPATMLRTKSDNMPPHHVYKDSQYAPAQSDQWLYEDPQGKIQGPFTATEMTEWYRAGYFDENLLVRQVFESRYSALGDLVKQRGSLPFGTSAPLPHAMKNDLSASHVSHEIPHSNIPQVKPTANPVQMLPSEYQFLQQKALILKLAEDHWALPSAEQQAANKGMVDINDYLMPPTSMNAKQSQSMGIPPNLNHPKHPILKQPSPASQQNMFNNHDFIASNSASPPDTSSALNRLMQQMSLNQHQTPLTIPMQHQQPPQPSPQNQYDAIQSLMMQLAMQKVPSTGLVAMPNNNQQHPIDKNSPNNGGWMGTNIGVAPHQPTLGQPSANAAASSWATNRIWPIQMPPMPGNAPLKLPTTINQQQQQQQLKTEKQIRDELKKDEPKKEDLINWKISNLTAQQQQAAVQHQHLQQQAIQQQQQQILEKQLLDKQREEKRKRDADSEKRTKAEEEKQKQSKKEAMKSEVAKKEPKADDKKRENEEKKRLKELKKQQAEDERRRQQEEEKRRQSIEEQKRLDDIAEQRKAKLMEGQRRSQQNDQNQSLPRQNANAPSVAPWSINPVAQVAKPSLSLAEIQKAERERRAEQSRIEQMIREQQQTQNLLESRQQKESTQKWNLQPHSVKSLAEIQAEESVKRQSISDQIALNTIAAATTSAKKRDADQAQQHLASIWNTNTTNVAPMWNAAAGKMWSNGSSISSGGFWEEPNKVTVKMSNSISNMSGGHSAASKTLVKSQTVSNMQQAAAKSTSKLQANAAKPIAKTNSSAAVSVSGPKVGKPGKKDREASENSNQEFNVWCFKALAAHENAIDGELIHLDLCVTNTSTIYFFSPYICIIFTRSRITVRS